MDVIDFSPSVFGKKTADDGKREEPYSGTYNARGEGYELYKEKRIRISQITFEEFDKLQRAIRTKVGLA